MTDAETVVEEHMSGADDKLVAARVKSEERVLVTLDLDFCNIQAYPPQHFAGIIVLRLQTIQTLEFLLNRWNFTNVERRAIVDRFTRVKAVLVTGQRLRTFLLLRRTVAVLRERTPMGELWIVQEDRVRFRRGN